MNTFLKQNESFITLENLIKITFDEKIVTKYYNDKIIQLQKLKFTDIEKQDFVYWYSDYKKSEMIAEFKKIPVIKNIFAEEIFLVAEATLSFFKPIADLLPLFANNTATEDDWQDLEWEQSFRDKHQTLDKIFDDGRKEVEKEDFLEGNWNGL